MVAHQETPKLVVAIHGFAVFVKRLADPQVTHTESKLGPARLPSGLRMLKNVVCL